MNRPAPTPPAKKPPVVPIALGALALIVVIGLIIALTGGDDGDDGDIDAGANSPAVTGSDETGSTDSTDAPASGDAAFGDVTITGDALPAFVSPDDDPAVGTAAPELAGQSLAGDPAAIEPGEPTIVAFLAHWCPHCQRELPLLVEETDDGTFDGVRMVAVLTGTNPDAPNFPPGQWIDREGWQGDTLLDDDQYSAAQAYGLSSYPYLVAIDAEGNVVARASGELPASDLADLAAAAKGA